MDNDPFFASEGDIDAARALVETIRSEQAELYVFPGDWHLFTDSSRPGYEPGAGALVVERSQAFLERACWPTSQTS